MTARPRLPRNLRPGPVYTPKDPVNIFKTFRHIFNVPREKKKKSGREVGAENYLFSDMEDIYADWISLTLSDQRTEKKRSKRGRKKSKKNELTSQAQLPRQTNFQSCCVSDKIPNKERKKHFRKESETFTGKVAGQTTK